MKETMTNWFTAIVMGAIAVVLVGVILGVGWRVVSWIAGF